MLLRLGTVSINNMAIDSDEIARSLSLSEARALASSLLEHHGVAAFKDVAAEVVAEYGPVAESD